MKLNRWVQVLVARHTMASKYYCAVKHGTWRSINLTWADDDTCRRHSSYDNAKDCVSAARRAMAAMLDEEVRE